MMRYARSSADSFTLAQGDVRAFSFSSVVWCSISPSPYIIVLDVCCGFEVKNRIASLVIVA